MLGFCDKVLNFELDLDSNSIILALGLFLCVTILLLLFNLSVDVLGAWDDLNLIQDRLFIDCCGGVLLMQAYCINLTAMCHSFYSCLIRFIFLFMAGSCHHYNYVLTNSSVYRLWKEV